MISQKMSLKIHVHAVFSLSSTKSEVLIMIITEHN